MADFGFSRDVMVNNIYERKSEGRLPIRFFDDCYDDDDDEDYDDDDDHDDNDGEQHLWEEKRGETSHQFFMASW